MLFNNPTYYLQFNPGNIDQDWQPSFFNLSVELMLEGLENAPFCDTYRYHAERGYGTAYQTQVSNSNRYVEYQQHPTP
jgi:hypothetical protein